MNNTIFREKLHFIRFIGSFLIIAMAFCLLPASADKAEAAPAVKTPTAIMGVMSSKNRTITVSWKKPAANSYVQVYLKTGNGQYNGIVTTNKTSYILRGMKPNVKYNVRLRTKQGSQYSKFVTLSRTFVYVPQAIKTPTAIKGVMSSKNRTITVSWKKPAANSYVQVYLKTGNGQYKGIVTTNKTSYILKGMKPNVKYNVRLRTKQGSQYSKFVTLSKTFVYSQAASSNQTAAPTQKPVTYEMVDSKNTRLVDLGFIKYVSIAFKQGYNKDNTSLEVDGTVINDAVTNVTDDGSVVKWELTSLSPAKLTVTDKNNAKATQAVALSNNKNPSKPEVVSDTAPAYIITHGPISTFDYYLPNYDDDGKLRVHPSKTTFDLNDKSTATAIKCYSPVAEIRADGTGTYGVSGTVELMFNWSTKEEKDWFDGIATTGALQLVRHDESKELITSNLKYTKETDVPHGSNRIAEIRVPVGQDNFFSNGRYYIRVSSANKMNGRRTVLVPVHVVNEVKPTLELNHGTEIRSGQNIHFNVKNMPYAIKGPIEKVELTGPDGKTRELTFIDDWFLIGDLFIIYNDVTANDGEGVNNIPLNGKYTVNICAAGFKDFSKSFKVVGGEDPGIVNTSYAGNGLKASASGRLKIDTVSSASVSTGGDSGSGGGGGMSVSADLLFDVDLLSNALILDRLGIANAYATAICDRFESEVIYDAVMDRSGKECYTFSSYVNAVSDAELDDDTYLTFRDFAASGKGERSTRNRASRVKEVLEDNLLGDIQEDAGYFGKQAPALNPKSGKIKVLEGNDAVFTADDASYLEKISSIEPKDPSSNETVSYEIKDGELIIHTSNMSFGEKAIIVKAEGYQKNQVLFIYKKDVEDVQLQLLTEAPKVKCDVTVKAGEKGDLLCNFRTATLQYEGGTPKTLHNKGEIGTSGNDWYEISQDRLTFTMKGGLFKKPGDYTLIIDAEYYEGVRIDFTVAEDIIDESGLSEAPQAVGVTSVEPVFFDSKYYRVSFSADGMDTDDPEKLIEDYLSGIESIAVSGQEYSRSQVSFTGPRAWQTANDPSYGGRYIYLKLTADGFAAGGDSTVEIRSEGYKTQTFVITRDLQIGKAI